MVDATFFSPQISEMSQEQRPPVSKDCIYPALVGCSTPVEAVLPQISSNMWWVQNRVDQRKMFRIGWSIYLLSYEVHLFVTALGSPHRSRGFGQLVRARNIKTVGDLSALTPSEIKTLPIRSPKISNVKKALKNYEQQVRQGIEGCNSIEITQHKHKYAISILQKHIIVKLFLYLTSEQFSFSVKDEVAMSWRVWMKWRWQPLNWRPVLLKTWMRRIRPQERH